MSGIIIRVAHADDHQAIANILELAFGGTGEAELVDRLRKDNDAVLELAAFKNDIPVGHIMFSRLKVSGTTDTNALALAPLAVLPMHQGEGVGSKLVSVAHEQLAAAGETLSIVLGEPEFYGRFGYEHQRALGFESQYQGEYLQALAFVDAPSSGTLIYAPAFGAL